MSDSMPASQNQNPNHSEQDAVVRDWLTTVPDAVKTLAMADFESWVRSNIASLPLEISSMPPSQLYQTLSQSSLALVPTQEKDATPGDNPARFQRTDQWIPVYE